MHRMPSDAWGSFEEPNTNPDPNPNPNPWGSFEVQTEVPTHLSGIPENPDSLDEGIPKIELPWIEIPQEEAPHSIP